MSSSIDIELILRTIDEVHQDWQQKFETTNDQLIQTIRKLYYDYQINAEQIVSKLKELRYSLKDLWPTNMDSFGRDIFNVETYHVEAAEFFVPVPFYPNDDILMKLYRWSVYDTNGIVIYRYYLERSEIMPGEPYYVLGKSYPIGHSQIQPYGATKPDYNRIKNDVINDLKGQGPLSIISLTV